MSNNATPERDEKEIQRILESGNFISITKNPIDEKELVNILVSQLISAYNKQTIISTITGAPASGKTILVKALIQKLTDTAHSSDFTQTDSYNILHRQERNQLIADGKKTPLEVKDFELLKDIVKKIRQGEKTNAPVYDEATGDAVVVGEKNFPHNIKDGIHFFFIEGDYQPLDDADVKIYLHLSTDIRRENRVERDLEKRGGYGDAKAIRKSFDGRLETQYYPYTLPNATKSDILIIAQANSAPPNYTYRHQYFYKVYKRVKK